MQPRTSSFTLASPRPVLVAVTAGLVMLAVVLLTGLADGLLASAAADADGPLLAPFRWTPLARGLV